LSIPSRGFWIEYFGKRLAFSTTQNSKESEINSFFYAHNVDRVIPPLKANNIRYIWIDKEMKNEIWSKEDEGLLLLFKNKEHFKKVYDEKGVQIWRII
jgi:asparagine N-glycosylation enzyme membrane subunit Stt3